MRKRRAGVRANLREAMNIAHGDPQSLDTDLPAAVSASPYVSEAATGNRLVANSDEITGYGV